MLKTVKLKRVRLFYPAHGDQLNTSGKEMDVFYNVELVWCVSGEKNLSCRLCMSDQN